MYILLIKTVKLRIYFLHLQYKEKHQMKRFIQILLLFTIVILLYMCIVSIQQGIKEQNLKETSSIELLKNENTNS